MRRLVASGDAPKTLEVGQDDSFGIWGRVPVAGASLDQDFMNFWRGWTRSSEFQCAPASRLHKAHVYLRENYKASLNPKP